MRILAVSDVVEPILSDRFDADWWKAQQVDLVVSCGDLPAEYLSLLVSAFNVPLFYVPGNHDGSYREAPPEGCDSIDGRLVTWNGLRIVGFGGSVWYNGGPEQYAEWQMELRILLLKPFLWRAGHLDLIVTHSPPTVTPEAVSPGSAQKPNPNDSNDHVHQGFHAFGHLIQAHHPRYLLHGHTHLCYGRAKRVVEVGGTPVIDVYGHYLLDL